MAGYMTKLTNYVFEGEYPLAAESNVKNGQ